MQDLVNRIRELSEVEDAPLLVALDGRSGSGKSTTAVAVAAGFDAVVIDGDDFYAGYHTAEWDAMSVAERSDRCIDWHRQRQVLEVLARGEPATWHAYDWEADNGSLSTEPTTAAAAAIVLLDGAYSARPELADLFDLRVLLELPEAVRRDRLLRREGERQLAEWEAQWSAAEDHYFTVVMPPEAFDLVIR